MRRTISLMVLLVGCSKSRTAPPPAEVDAAAINKPMTTIEVDAGPPPQPLDRSAPASREARARAVLALVHGGRAIDLPEQAVDPLREWDPTLAFALAPPVKAPVLEQDSITVEGGGFEEAAAARILTNAFGRFSSCYEIERELRPDVTGVVRLTLALDPKGAVRNASDAGSKIDAPGLIKCVLGEAMRLSFPQPTGGALVKITYGIKFMPPK